MNKEINKGKLSIVATPIGNLEDITFRAIRTLKEADMIVAEQPNITRKLLERYDIGQRPVKLDQHASTEAIGRILELLRHGQHIAYVTSAGTPGISDPGWRLVSAIEEFEDLIVVEPIPGPSAVIALASVSGVPVDRFVFLGFPPVKKGRKTLFEKIAEYELPVIIYESPHRIIKTLTQLKEACGDERRIVVGRELTKQFEEIFRGTLFEANAWVAESSPRGEYTLLIRTQDKEKTGA